MTSFRLSEHAASELLDIHAYSEVQFGRYQADAYLAGNYRIFSI